MGPSLINAVRIRNYSGSEQLKVVCFQSNIGKSWRSSFFHLTRELTIRGDARPTESNVSFIDRTDFGFIWNNMAVYLEAELLWWELARK